ncbi:MAG: UvrD-helicase domain-containing protein [Wolbachia sp.]
MSTVFYYKGFDENALGNIERKKFDEIVKDLKGNKLTYQGNIKLISSKGGIKYLRAKLSDEGRLLFTQVKHNNEDVFVMLEVIPHHDYEKSHFLQSTEKTKNIEIKVTEEGVTEKSSDVVEIKDLERAHWLGKLVTFSATQEDIVKRAEECELPLVISGSAGSGKTSVALESLKKIQEKFEGGKILYITKSENLTKESKKLFECNEVTGELETSTPKEIDFSSIHEFFEKRIKKDVEGKKPIDRNKFFPWFKKMCEKSEFKKYKNEGEKIFEEFTAVIAGKALSKGYSYGKGEYKKLGKRESIFAENERDSVYGFFEEYRKFIEKDSEYYDPNLIAHECAEEKVYDAIVVDEVQDLTESTLGLILGSLKDGSKRNFLLCGDVNQVVHPSFFSISKLRSFLCQNKSYYYPQI